MSSKSGNGKRSYVGQRVAALIGDGYYAPATIQSSTISDSGKEEIFIVKFDDGNTTKCTCSDMIGTNFRSTSDIHMQRLQKVFTNHNGREVSGYIQNYQGDQILISIPGNSNEKEIILRKPEDIRLLDSRRSQRLQQNIPVDYRKMSERGSPCKSRAVSASIEVPKPSRIRRTSEEPTMTELMAAMVLSNLSCSPVFHNPSNTKGSSPRSYDSSGVGSWNQDSQHTSPTRQAEAMRNTNMSSSILLNNVKSEPNRESTISGRYYGSSFSQRSPTPDDPIDADSGMILLQPSTPTKTSHFDQSTEMEDEPQDLSVPKVRVEQTVSPRPPSHSSQTSSFSDQGRLEVVMEHEEDKVKKEPEVPIPIAMPIAISPQIPLPYYFTHGFLPQPFPVSLPAELRVHLAPTPPVPHATTPPIRARSPDPGSSAPGYIDSKMHRHLHRTAPYHKVVEDSSAPSPVGGSSPSSLTFGSAPSSFYPFHNSPIPVASLSFSPSHHSKVKKSDYIRSPLASTAPSSPYYTSSSKSAHSTPIAVPASASGYPVLKDRPFPNSMPAQPITIPSGKAYSWQAGATTSQYAPKSIVQQRQQMHQAASPKMTYPLSPKNIGRKVRGDGKKCRKVYGMENRDMWCTACRWKKACQRFPD